MEREDKLYLYEQIQEKLMELNELAQQLDEEADEEIRRHILSETQGASRGWLGQGFLVDEVNKMVECLHEEEAVS